MHLKESLEHIVLESSRDVRKIKNTDARKLDWNSYLQIEGEFVVEIGITQPYHAFIKICSIDEFYNTNSHPNTALIEVEKEYLEDYYNFKLEIGKVSKEVEKYTLELFGRTFLLLNSSR